MAEFSITIGFFIIPLTVLIIRLNFVDHKTQVVISIDEFREFIDILRKVDLGFQRKEEFGDKFFNLDYPVILQMKTMVFVLATIFTLTVILGLNLQMAIAESTTTITPINDEISLKKTVVPMNIPIDNTFPWGAVRGQASEVAERYPVIIQIFKGEDPVHFAQVDVKGDGSFEYKFRVRNVDVNTGEVINIFEGQYTVNIFRVIPNSDERI